MSDDFKLSVDIEADLSRLDNTLNAAEAKVAAAGQRMQRSLTGGGGGSGGYAGVSPIAGPQASPGSANIFTPRGGTFFGPNLNAMGGNGGAPPPAPPWWLFAGGQTGIRGVLGSLGNSALGAMGMGGYGAMASNLGTAGGVAMVGTAIAVATASRAFSISTNALQNERAMRTAGDLQGLGTSAGASGGLLQQAQAIENRQAPGLLRYFPGANGLAQTAYSNAAEREFQKGGGINLNNLRGVAATMSESFAAQSANLSAYGDFAGRAATLQRERQQIDADYVRKRDTEGAVTADIWWHAQNDRLTATAQVMNTQQINAVRTTRLSGTQAVLGAMGMGTMSNVLGIQNDLQNQLSMTPDVAGNKPMRDAMRIAAGGKTVAALMGGMTPAQEFTPGMVDMGSGAIRSGSMRNQDPGVLTALNDIAKKVGEMHPLITH